MTVNRGTDFLFFDSVEAFFEETRENRIQHLIEELTAENHDSSAAEKNSWKNSLPDLAKLLCCPEAYLEETKKECAHYILALDYFKTLIAAGHFEKLEQFLEDEDIRKNVSKVFDKETMTALKEMTAAKKMIEEPDTFNDEQIEMSCCDAMEAEVRKLNSRKDMTGRITLNQGTHEAGQGLPRNLKVLLECKLENNHRIDVLLSDPGQNKHVIIELKQWTEENIELCADEAGREGRAVRIKEYNETQMHPALKVREDYREHLKADVGENAEIMCLVYLHNQFYEGSTLFSAPSEVLYDTEKFNGQNIIMYSRMRCEQFRERICSFFQPE